MGHVAGPELKAQMDLGTLVPYIMHSRSGLFCTLNKFSNTKKKKKNHNFFFIVKYHVVIGVLENGVNIKNKFT